MEKKRDVMGGLPVTATTITAMRSKESRPEEIRKGSMESK